jgi:N-acetylglucosaminyldiphosphoundecaprenol N-acetyl-beta-D-mannosaminyltransferase
LATRVWLLGNRLDAYAPDEAMDELMRRLDERNRARVYFINAHCLNVASKDPSYRQALAEAELVLADGSGVLLGSRLLGIPVVHNLNGTDLVPRLLEKAAMRQRTVYLLGGMPGVAARVAATLQQRFDGLRIAGFDHGYVPRERHSDVVARIRAARPDILLVAMGVPLQEEWLREHWDELPVTLGIAVGALFDFLSGRLPRAPRWMRALGIEWSYRLLLEPRRLWRRYLVGNVTFMLRVLAAVRTGRGRVRAGGAAAGGSSSGSAAAHGGPGTEG